MTARNELFYERQAFRIDLMRMNEACLIDALGFLERGRAHRYREIAGAWRDVIEKSGGIGQRASVIVDAGGACDILDQLSQG